ncbi:MAG: hypothetical protein P1U41_03260 [Vicingaceae bacterium]|nr:hypothetical protein [Vicingaceae bacterium]
MTKKILLGLFILLMGAVSFIAYNFYKNVKEPVSQTAFEAIPLNAALIIKENNFHALFEKINSTNIIWEELTTHTASAKDLNNKMNYLDSLLNGPFKTIIKNKEVLGSLHLSGANNYDFIFYLSIPSVETDEIIQKIKNVTKTNPNKRDYDGVAINTFPYLENEKIALTHYKNTLAFSFSTVLIEDVIRQLKNETNLLSDSTFAQVIRTSGQSSDGNLFVNNQYFSKIINQYLNKSSKAYFKNYENYATWTELDITIKPNSLALNGFSFANDKNIVTLLKNQKPQDIDMLEILPYNTAFLYHYGVSNSELFFDNRMSLLKGENQFFNFQKYLDEQTSDFGIDLEVELLNHISSEIAMLITESQTEDFSNNKYVILKIKDVDEAKESLKALSIKTNDEPIEPIIFNEKSIAQLNLKNVFQNLLGKPFPNFSNHYYTFIDDYVVFSNSSGSLQSFITNVTNEKVLSKNDNFESFNENLSSNSNLFIYNNIARSVNLYKTICKEDDITVFEDQLELFRKFEAVAYQMSTEKNNLYYNNMYLKYNPVYKQETASLWELALDTNVSNEPQIVTNHKTSGKEIIVQDDANKIYLISNTGKVIWSKQLAEKVMSKFQQIDVYKNNKLQLLFNTKSKIYLLDRNGNNVENYPVKLDAEATNDVTPIDYDKNRNYRILIGCSNNMVYNYDITGNKVKGWEYSSTQSPAKGNIWHFAIGGKDYVVIPLQNGQIKIVERAGKDRIKLDKMLPTGNTVYLKVGSSLAKSYLISADSNSTIVKLFFNDKKEALKIDNAPSKATFSFFDFNSDKAKDYILNSANKLLVVDNQKKELFKMDYENNISQQPISFKLSQNKTGLVIQNQIYLINNDGTLEDGFPLAGSTTFHIADINNDQIMNLVVAHNKMIYTYNLK